jgi:hypothetical protein
MVYFRPSKITGLVNVSGDVSLSRLDIIEYAEVTSIADGTLTTILTHTAAAEENISLIACSGCDYAKFQIFIDTVLKGTKRSGPSSNVEWNYPFPLALDSGQVLDVKVTHFDSLNTHNFEAGLYAFTSA